MPDRPYILTIAGFDPSGGAGLTADIKTMEKLKCYGLAVCSANTIQNDVTFKACHWTLLDTMKEQLSLLLDRFEIKVAKVGIIENWDVLNELVDFLLEKNPAIKIILDPVLKASADYKFHAADRELLEKVLSKVFMITPNYEEIQALGGETSVDDTVKRLSALTHVYLKGGHRPEQLGKDELYSKDGKCYGLSPRIKGVSEKHGSGCILSSAIACYIAKDFTLLKACYRAKRYTEKALSSNKSLLAYHG